MAAALPITGTNHRTVAGMQKATSRPVTTADPSPTVTGTLRSFWTKASHNTAVAALRAVTR